MEIVSLSYVVFEAIIVLHKFIIQTRLTQRRCYFLGQNHLTVHACVFRYLLWYIMPRQSGAE